MQQSSPESPQPNNPTFNNASMLAMPMYRDRITVRGQVQGVGCRPFIYRLATELKLTGTVENTAVGVVIEVEGKQSPLQQFYQRLQKELPPPGHIQSLDQKRLSIKGSKQFKILTSQSTCGTLSSANAESFDDGNSTSRAQILPDLSTCAECLQDIFSADNRRHRYAFTNCTHCGPRYSIITALPYDRCHTTMSAFVMCSACGAEYNTPTQRRFHAQPNACCECGPSLAFWAIEKDRSHDPLESAIATLKRGNILALKGLGGFQLLVDAHNPDAINRLRQRKGRPDKPFALMYPALEAVRCHCEVSAAAAALLTSAEAPIVLLPRRQQTNQQLSPESGVQSVDKMPALAAGIAPNNPFLGVMLPTTPLHHLLLRQYGVPLVATSGNLSSEPICTREQEARWRLVAIADAFLVHNRPIQRPVDDSVVHLVQAQPQVLRHARGYAPQVIQVPRIQPNSQFNRQVFGPLASEHTQIAPPKILALGAHLKSAIAVSIGDEIMLSQHIGDLDTPKSREQLKKTVDDFLSLYEIEPDAIACDQHPDYGSTQLAHTLAKDKNIPLIPVQHHYAHILSCMAEHQLQPPALGIAWDGTGYGPDQTIWGGEFFNITHQGFDRIAHFLPYSLPGGDGCALEPRRAALGLLYSCYGEAAFEMTDLPSIQAFKKTQRVILCKMLTHQINAPKTSSVGRLFDGIASLLNLQQITSFEGQAALTLEFAATQSSIRRTYPFSISDSQPHAIDWRAMVRAIVEDCRNAVTVPVIAVKFHNTLVEMMIDVARRAKLSQVTLGGGCFQNTLLTEQAIRRLSMEGFNPYWPQRIPPNDGGLAVGQVMAAWHHLSHAEASTQFYPSMTSNQEGD